jgi:DNA-binding MarR family transcriptional regulator
MDDLADGSVRTQKPSPRRASAYARPAAKVSPPAAGEAFEAPEDLAEILRPLLLRLARRLHREAGRIGVSALDAQLLSVIRKRTGIGVSGLAALERMSAPAMSAHVKRLEAAGWVRRRPSEGGGDGRRAPLELTPEGAEALELIRLSRNNWLAERLAALGSDERVLLEAAAPALGRLLEVKP